ncbi:MAG: nuclear transport factor 2 family protein [Deltaproteobacteria bacterium]|nr:nuclear transport factor 2 family protein [Deltaproteobacteria bacterium]
MTLRESSIPDAADLEANVRWLRDVELIKQLVQRYAHGVDTLDFELVRSVFHPDCVVAGTLEDGQLEPYLGGIEEGLQQWQATMHFIGNQYVSINEDNEDNEDNGDEGHVESWAVAYHMEADDSPLDDLRLGLRYQDDVVRVGSGWKIIRRNVIKQWHRGPFPRPSLGPPIYPRPR